MIMEDPGGSVSNSLPVAVDNDTDQDEGENHVDVASPVPSSNKFKRKRDNIAGTHHVPCSGNPRDQRVGNNPEVGTHEVGKTCGKVVNNSADPASSICRLGEGPEDPRGDSSEGLGTHLPLNSALQMASQTQPCYDDPLQKELDRVDKEKEGMIKIHEDAKLGLESEFNKELREAIAGIRRKYDNKFHNVESAFSREKKEINSNMKKVLMNKILADAIP